MRIRVLLAMTVLSALGAPLSAAPPAGDGGMAWVRATIMPLRSVVPVGSPVLVDFLLSNAGSEPVTLTVSGTTAPDDPVTVAGLPIEHVFSAIGRRGPDIASAGAEQIGFGITRPSSEAPAITLMPGGLIGRRVDLAEMYTGLRQPGSYSIEWAPYNGAIISNRIRIEVAQLQQAVLETGLGSITMRFHYEVAPAHVANFIELTREGFYEGKIFHRVIPGTLVQTGCPRGDGTGVQPNGRTLRAEFSDLPHRFGTVSMARKEDDIDSASCQFFICLMPIPEFDGRYTVFAEVVGEASYDTLRRFNEIKTDKWDRPYQKIKIESARIESVPTGVPPLDDPLSDSFMNASR